MKKLIIAFSVALCAVAVNAATVSWNSGTIRSATSATGGWASGGVKKSFADGTALAVSVFLVNSEVYTSASKLSSAELYKAYATQTASATATSEGNSVVATTTAAVGTDYYAVVIYSYTDKTYGDMYIATTATIDGTLIDNAANIYNVSDIGSTAGSASGWTSAGAIPEPTSGLLMLVGLAGLALRRKRA